MARDIWLDYSGARPDPHDMKRLGVVGVFRYLSALDPATAWKRITVAEKDAILAAGLDLVLNFEWYEGRMLEGASAGATDGATAYEQARALGYPKGATIYFSHDTSARDDAAVVAYLRAAQVALGDDYYADIYSGFDVVQMAIRTGVARYGWQTLAWSNGRVGRAHIYQNGNGWFNREADEDVVRGPVGSWLETEGKTPSPHPRPHPRPPKPVKRTVTRPYLVKPGDTLTKIAINHHMTVAELVRLNPRVGGHPNFIFIGEVLRVPKSGAKPTPPPGVKKYRVVPGDTLGNIAKQFGTTVHQLQAWNPIIKNPNLIHVGWILRVH